MPDNRDFRVRIDLNFDSAKQGVAQGLYNHAKGLVDQAVNIHVGEPWQEIGHVSLERCGHRLNEECTLLEEELVP